MSPFKIIHPFKTPKLSASRAQSVAFVWHYHMFPVNRQITMLKWVQHCVYTPHVWCTNSRAFVRNNDRKQLQAPHRIVTIGSCVKLARV